MKHFYSFWLIGFVCLIGTRSVRAQLYEDTSTAAGVLVNHNFDTSVDFYPMGTGAAWGDYDGDGRVDLYVTQMDKNPVDTDGRNYLFKNNGDGTFTDVTVAAGVEDPNSRGAAVTFTDYDNDGDLDIYIGNSGYNVLYRNDGAGTFTDVTLTAFTFAEMDTGNTMSIAWGDYDKDGWLDLFYTNHQTIKKPNPDTQLPERLFHSNGDGTFSDVSALLGSERLKNYGFGAHFVDYDNDHDLDIFLVNDCPFTGVGTFVEDERDNKLWRNDGSDGAGGWIFTEIADLIMPDSCTSAMGLATGDYNNDGYFDFAFTNIGPSVLLKSNSALSFSNEAALAGVSFDSTTDNAGLNTIRTISWGTEFFDYDNDGKEDLFIVAGDLLGTVAMANGLFKNNGDGTFTDMFSAGDPTFDDSRGRTIAVADYDKDGFLDYYIVSIGQEGRLYHNLGTPGRHWLRVEVHGTVSNADAIGTRLTAITADGNRQIREIRNGSGYGAGTEIAAYFGLGSNSSVDTLIVEWPSGIVDTVFGQSAQTRLSVTEPGIANVLDLAAANSGTAISLSWGAPAGAQRYNLFRATEAYFDTTGNFLITVNPATSYDDVDDNLGNDVIGDPDTSYFYKITAAGGRFETDSSNVVGELDYALNAGFNFITLPLSAAGLADAEALGLSIDGQVGGAGASAIYQMVGGSWQLMAFKLSGAWVLTVTDPLVVGQAYLVNMDVAGTWTVVGGLEPDITNSLGVDFNTIMLPFEKASVEAIVDAETLGLSIDAGAVGDGATAIYRMVAGSWQLMAFKLAGAWVVTITDPVMPGHAYLVNMSENVTW